MPLFDRVPGLENFIRNLIDTSPRIQIPAVQQAAVTIFSRDGVSESDMDDEEVCRFINELLIEKAPPKDMSDTADIGRGLGKTDDTMGEMDSNKDPWILLTPQKNSY